MSVAVSWSSGKDAAWTLHLLRQQGENVVALVTTVVRDEDRVPIHGTRRSVLRRQAAAVDLPLVEVELPWPCSDELYRFAVTAALEGLKRREEITAVAYGDLFLSDVRRFRERMLSRIGVEALFPLWGIRSDLLAQRMLRGGVEATVVSVDPTRVDAGIAGRPWNGELLRRLPSGVDPCGERGEFHTVVTSGPMFTAPVEVELGEVTERDGFVYADLAPPRRYQ